MPRPTRRLFSFQPSPEPTSLFKKMEATVVRSVSLSLSLLLPPALFYPHHVTESSVHLSLSHPLLTGSTDSPRFLYGRATRTEVLYQQTLLKLRVPVTAHCSLFWSRVLCQRINLLRPNYQRVTCPLLKPNPYFLLPRTGLDAAILILTRFGRQ